MITHLLDTSVYSQRLRKYPVEGVVRRWSELGNSRLAISAFCEAELLYGLEKKDSARLWAEYEEYLKNALVMLPLERKVIEAYAKTKVTMSREGLVVDEPDLLIGATALANNLTLATLNSRHFEKIPNLPVEDWS
ncbi:MAG TPA: type II toxin-antitoxin system VapC family toxin [Opitutales bacterium]|nr:type II toxin-antitoxin system VapC family toxin [Opitutales bacterium]